MRVIINEPVKPEVELGLGDVIHYKSSFYLVTRLENTYCARSFNGEHGMFGKYDTMKELNEAFNRKSWVRESTVYKASEYSLQLVKN